MSRVIVCGWHTPDYAHWLQPLAADLDGLGIDRDFVAVPKPEGWSWERVTRLKAEQARLAMLRQPDRTVVFVDVDCRVLRPLDGLADIRGDVAVHMTARFRRHGGFKFRVRSGTIVLQPTASARLFVQTWAHCCQSAPWAEVDQGALAVAMGHTSGVAFENLDIRYCAIPSDRVTNPAILHDSASRHVGKVACWRKWLPGYHRAAAF